MVDPWGVSKLPEGRSYDVREASGFFRASAGVLTSLYTGVGRWSKR